MPKPIIQWCRHGIKQRCVRFNMVFNNITVDCDNRNEANESDPNTTGNPIEIAGGTGSSDYNFSWNSDGAPFFGATPGAHGSLVLDPGFVNFDSTVHGRNDYRLTSTSPLIGLGTAGLTGANGFVEVVDDIDGIARPQDGSYEPGPHEFTTTPVPRLHPISEHASNPILTPTPTSCVTPTSAVTVAIAKWKSNKQSALVLQRPKDNHARLETCEPWMPW